ncbi:sodium/hydrogen exchanger 9B2 isoform X1 [Drosophila miranda]|uniref:sodium/hydrogen exchanger 9B2 isoform X1 n=2 Tax=Drosophila miranda TaxID=7229 RepID=UPI0007E70D0C|nr:sodium/hydrogen exchanger 9B2 isoform X1 [Drosophila miranda]
MFTIHKTMTATGEPGARDDSSVAPASLITTPTTIIAPSPIPVLSDVPMPNGNGNGNGSGAGTGAGAGNNFKSSIVIDSQPKRRVSIISDPPMIAGGGGGGIGGAAGPGAGYDNPAFEQNPRRKISQTSTHSHTDIGPARRKSILKDTATTTHDNESDRVSTHSYENYRQNALDVLNAKYNGHQMTHSSAGGSNGGANFVEESWMYTFCLKCRGEEPSSSWEPPFWQKIFPYPLCPTFRTFSRLVSIILIGVLIWITAFVIIGDSAAPGGQLFSLVVLTVAANFGGYLISLTTLPRLIGMLLVGILFQNVGWVNLDGDFSVVTAHLRKFALTIILTRAGLEMEPEAFKKVYKTILKLGIIPWCVEAVIVAVMSHFLLDLPWIWSFLLGSIIAAVSPAVVVPCLFRLRTKGYGVAKGIPTLVVAVAGVDDALSVAIFGIISTVMFSDKGLAYQIAQAPVCILGGLGFGVLWGSLARIFPEKGDAYVVPLRTLLLFTGGLMAIYGSEELGFEGAGPLAVVFSAFVSNLFWCKDGWDVEDNPVSTAFEIFWMIFEPILFGITGSTIKIRELDSHTVSIGAACIFTGAILRIFTTAGIAFGDRLNLKEKFFVGLSWMAKATVQAALGPVALKHLDENSTEEERNYASIVQTICVFSIVLTAPLGAILISVTGTKLLTKTKQPQDLTGWRRSHRPSIRDISIIDEEEEREDPEIPEDKETHDNTLNNAHIPSISYTYNT